MFLDVSGKVGKGVDNCVYMYRGKSRPVPAFISVLVSCSFIFSNGIYTKISRFILHSAIRARGSHASFLHNIHKINFLDRTDTYTVYVLRPSSLWHYKWSSGCLMAHAPGSWISHPLLHMTGRLTNYHFDGRPLTPPKCIENFYFVWKFLFCFDDKFK